jgi:hypothetical protein
MFGKHIRSVFSPAFKQSPDSVKKKLLTLFKTWYLFYPHEILNTIYNELGLAKFEVELLTPQDHKKIKAFIDSKKTRDLEEKKRPTPAPQRPPMPVDPMRKFWSQRLVVEHQLTLL